MLRLEKEARLGPYLEIFGKELDFILSHWQVESREGADLKTSEAHGGR